jgi:hypothetical protein
VSKHHEVLEVQKSMLAIHAERDKLFKELIGDLGYGENRGLNLDIMSKFGWKIVELNRQFESLSARHKELMGY